MASLPSPGRAPTAAPRSSRSARARSSDSADSRRSAHWADLLLSSRGEKGLPLADLLFHRAEKEFGRRDGLVDAQDLEDPDVGRVIDAGNGPFYVEALLGQLQRDQVVLVVPGDGEHHVGPVHSCRAEK